MSGQDGGPLYCYNVLSFIILFFVSLQLLMETVDSEVRSCPLCQLAFPVGYPDDVLIKHIDSHLENSKI